MNDLQMVIDKIDELKSDNDQDHKEIKDAIKLFPCMDHAIKIQRLETLVGTTSNEGKNNKLDDIVTKRVMYIFGGIIAGVVLLLKELPRIVNAVKSIGG